jgi:hypothetical protein
MIWRIADIRRWEDPMSFAGTKEDDMFRALICAAGVGTLLTALVTTPSQAQYDLNTCSGRLAYCSEWARRAGAPTTQCEAAYQECQRTRVPERRYLDNPYAGAVDRPTPYNPYPGAVDRPTPNPYVGPLEQEFCLGRVNCLPRR